MSHPPARAHRPRRRIVTLCAVLACVGLLPHTTPAPRTALDPAARPWKSWRPGLDAAQLVEGPQLRPADWFTRQRAFPYGTIPEAARRQALDDARRFAEREGAPRTSAAWQPAGPVNIGGRITDVAMHPSVPARIFIGTADGGVFRSIDDGQTWTPVFDEALSLSIGAVAIDPADPDVVYAGTGEANAAGDTYAGVGVYVSTDAGESWDHLGLTETAKIGRIVVDPVDSNRLYVAAMGRLYDTNPERGLYRSIDAGASWERVLFVDDSTGVVDVVVDPTNTDRLLAASWERIRRPYARRVGGPGSGIHASTDGGDTWTRLGPLNGLPGPGATVGRIGLTLCASDPSVVYAIYADDPGNFDGVYRSNDGGVTWSRVNDGALSSLTGGFGWYFGQIRVDPSDPDRVFALGVPLYRTTNGGASWSSVAGNVHVDHHALLVDPTNSSRVLLGNDGGYYRSANGGTAWTKSFDLPISQFYAITVDPQQPWRIYGGTQDNSTMRTPSGATDDWEIIYGGDGFTSIVDPTNPNVIYAQYQYGGLGKSTDGGDSWDIVLTGIPSSDRRNWSTPLEMDPASHTRLYYGTYRVFRTTNGAASWSAISGDLTGGPSPGNLVYGTITTIAVAPSDPDALMAGTDDGRVWVTRTGGGSWTEITAGLPERWVTRVAFHPTDPDVAYVTLSGYRLDESLPHVFRTTTGGTSWEDISGDLPGVPLNDIEVDPAYPAGTHLYVVADAGVYGTTDGGVSWQVLGAGLPPVVVHDLHLHAPTRTLVAGTHGRSAYTLDLDAIVGVAGAPLADRARVDVAPNPMRTSALFRVETTRDGPIAVDVFDAGGRRVRRLDAGARGAGTHLVEWDGRTAGGERVAPGVYFYRVRTGAGPIDGRLVVIEP